MTGKNISLVGLLRKIDNGLVLHCIIHQEVLCGKFVKMNYVLKDLTRIVNLIRGGNREFSAEFHEIPLHSEIHWLSAAFLTDITEHLNILNLKLQGKKQNICQLMSHIEAIRKKLRMFEEDLKSDLKFFKSCSEIKNEFNSADFKQHGQYVIELREEFGKQFSDFDNMKTIFQLFADPMAVMIGDQDPKLQMELCELQSDIQLS
ncbi:hypothetical protein PR048_017594 [Dryococelus australis]|uniref:General transcription factor II-I repeat domain-containing protein 2 n=1 Tax=Dryococelus australis TaxID=614101 RepID=A0ABQ9HA79_9NEOP|nr:hypothetical protein PR048_017594 [Dryococelus australis]